MSILQIENKVKEAKQDSRAPVPPGWAYARVPDSISQEPGELRPLRKSRTRVQGPGLSPSSTTTLLCCRSASVFYFRKWTRVSVPFLPRQVVVIKAPNLSRSRSLQAEPLTLIFTHGWLETAECSGIILAPSTAQKGRCVITLDGVKEGPAHLPPDQDLAPSQGLSADFTEVPFGSEESLGLRRSKSCSYTHSPWLIAFLLWVPVFLSCKVRV